MILFPSLARAQSGSPYNKDFVISYPYRGVLLMADYTAESAGTMTLDLKLQIFNDAESEFEDFVTPAEAGVDFVQFTGVAEQRLYVYAGGPAEELAVVPTLLANMPIPPKLRLVATIAGGAGADTVTFSVAGVPLL